MPSTATKAVRRSETSRRANYVRRCTMEWKTTVPVLTFSTDRRHGDRACTH
jgi:hypothetical protein